VRDLDWLEEFLAPAFTRANPAVCDRRVMLDTDAARHAAMLDLGPAPCQAPVSCFVMDSHIICYRKWGGTDPAERVVFDAEHQIFYRVDERTGDIGILAMARPDRARMALMRVVRELAMVASVESGGLLLHGAAFATGARGVVLAGPKGAGKTTLLLHLLRVAGTALLANDRVLVRIDEGRPLLRGMPTVVKIRPGTLAMLPALAAAIVGAAYDHTRTVWESSQGPGGPRLGSDETSRLTLAQLSRITGSVILAQAELSRLVFLHGSDATSGIRLERLDPETTARRLRTVLFGAESPGRVSEVFSGSSSRDVIDEVALHRRSDELARLAPGYDAHVGSLAHTDAECAAEVVRQLTADSV
jgi:hypothetical protein